MPYKDPTQAKLAKLRHYQKNKEVFIQRKVTRKEEIRKYLDDLKSKLKCEICGENHPACLDFHHRNPNEKLFTLANAIRRAFSIEKIEKEISKCQILCSNCHRKIHYKESLGIPGGSIKRTNV